jgi:hypothetical protein
MKKIAGALALVRKAFLWQLTVSEVSFITADGVTRVVHIHPAWWSKQRVFEDALYLHLPSMVGEVDE